MIFLAGAGGCAVKPAPPSGASALADKTTTPVSTPLSATGTVVGRLVSADSEHELTGLAVYFGTLVPLTPGPDHLINLDLTYTPKAYIGADGRIVAENIPPGKYALVVWSPKNSRFVPDPENPGREFVVTVREGRITDIGTLMVPPP